MYQLDRCKKFWHKFAIVCTAKLRFKGGFTGNSVKKSDINKYQISKIKYICWKSIQQTVFEIFNYSFVFWNMFTTI